MFPFIYNDKEYQACTWVDAKTHRNNRPWCGTTFNASSHWGDCKEDCPIEGNHLLLHFHKALNLVSSLYQSAKLKMIMLASFHFGTMERHMNPVPGIMHSPREVASDGVPQLRPFRVMCILMRIGAVAGKIGVHWKVIVCCEFYFIVMTCNTSLSSCSCAQMLDKEEQRRRSLCLPILEWWQGAPRLHLGQRILR